MEAKIVQLESELVAERRITQRERTINSKLQKQLARVSTIHNISYSSSPILQNAYNILYTEGRGQLGKWGSPPCWHGDQLDNNPCSLLYVLSVNGRAILNSPANDGPPSLWHRVPSLTCIVHNIGTYILNG